MATYIDMIEGTQSNFDPSWGDSVRDTKYITMYAFYGGSDRGTCVQIHTGKDFIELTADQARRMRDALQAFCDAHPAE